MKFRDELPPEKDKSRKYISPTDDYRKRYPKRNAQKRVKSLLGEFDRDNSYRWRNLRTAKDMDGVETTPISDDKLKLRTCRKRTCRKKFIPTMKNKFLCDDCYTRAIRIKKVEDKFRTLSSPTQQQ